MEAMNCNFSESIDKIESESRKRDFVAEEQEQEQRKKNKDFVQYKRKGLGYLRKVIKDNPFAAEIFVFLSEFMDYKNAVCCTSKVLEEYFNTSRSSVYRAVKYLEDNAYVIVANAGSARVFTVNPDIAWTTYADKKSLCEFNGKILLSASENKELQAKAEKFKAITLKEMKNIV